MGLWVYALLFGAVQSQAQDYLLGMELELGPEGLNQIIDYLEPPRDFRTSLTQEDLDTYLEHDLDLDKLPPQIKAKLTEGLPLKSKVLDSARAPLPLLGADGKPLTDQIKTTGPVRPPIPKFDVPQRTAPPPPPDTMVSTTAGVVVPANLGAQTAFQEVNRRWRAMPLEERRLLVEYDKLPRARRGELLISCSSDGEKIGIRQTAPPRFRQAMSNIEIVRELNPVLEFKHVQPLRSIPEFISSVNEVATLVGAKGLIAGTTGLRNERGFHFHISAGAESNNLHNVAVALNDLRLVELTNESVDATDGNCRFLPVKEKGLLRHVASNRIEIRMLAKPLADDLKELAAFLAKPESEAIAAIRKATLAQLTPWTQGRLERRLTRTYGFFQRLRIPVPKDTLVTALSRPIDGLSLSIEQNYRDNVSELVSDGGSIDRQLIDAANGNRELTETLRDFALYLAPATIADTVARVTSDLDGKTVPHSAEDLAWIDRFLQAGGTHPDVSGFQNRLAAQLVSPDPALRDRAIRLALSSDLISSEFNGIQRSAIHTALHDALGQHDGLLAARLWASRADLKAVREILASGALTAPENLSLSLIFRSHLESSGECDRLFEKTVVTQGYPEGKDAHDWKLLATDGSGQQRKTVIRAVFKTAALLKNHPFFHRGETLRQVVDQMIKPALDLGDPGTLDSMAEYFSGRGISTERFREALSKLRNPRTRQEGMDLLHFTDHGRTFEACAAKIARRVRKPKK